VFIRVPLWCALFAPVVALTIHAGLELTFLMGLLSVCLVLSIATTLVIQMVLLKRRQREEM